MEEALGVDDESIEAFDKEPSDLSHMFGPVIRGCELRRSIPLEGAETIVAARERLSGSARGWGCDAPAYSPISRRGAASCSSRSSSTSSPVGLSAGAFPRPWRPTSCTTVAGHDRACGLNRSVRRRKDAKFVGSAHVDFRHEVGMAIGEPPAIFASDRRSKWPTLRPHPTRRSRSAPIIGTSNAGALMVRISTTGLPRKPTFAPARNGPLNHAMIGGDQG